MGYDWTLGVARGSALDRSIDELDKLKDLEGEFWS